MPDIPNARGKVISPSKDTILVCSEGNATMAPGIYEFDPVQNTSRLVFLDMHLRSPRDITANDEHVWIVDYHTPHLSVIWRLDYANGSFINPVQIFEGLRGANSISVAPSTFVKRLYVADYGYFQDIESNSKSIPVNFYQFDYKKDIPATKRTFDSKTCGSSETIKVHSSGRVFYSCNDQITVKETNLFVLPTAFIPINEPAYSFDFADNKTLVVMHAKSISIVQYNNQGDGINWDYIQGANDYNGIEICCQG